MDGGGGELHTHKSTKLGVYYRLVMEQLPEVRMLVRAAAIGPDVLLAQERGMGLQTLKVGPELLVLSLELLVFCLQLSVVHDHHCQCHAKHKAIVHQSVKILLRVNDLTKDNCQVLSSHLIVSVNAKTLIGYRHGQGFRRGPQVPYAWVHLCCLEKRHTSTVGAQSFCCVTHRWKLDLCQDTKHLRAPVVFWASFFGPRSDRGLGRHSLEI